MVAKAKDKIVAGVKAAVRSARCGNHKTVVIDRWPNGAAKTVHCKQCQAMFNVPRP
jgi:hypothetical protein